MENPEKCEWNEINRLKSPNRLKRTTFSSKPVLWVIFDWVDQKYVFHLFSIRNNRNLYVNGKQPRFLSTLLPRLKETLISAGHVTQSVLLVI